MIFLTRYSLHMTMVSAAIEDNGMRGRPVEQQKKIGEMLAKLE